MIFVRSCSRALKCTAAKGMPAARASGMSRSIDGDARSSAPIPAARDAGFLLAAVHFSARLRARENYLLASLPTTCVPNGAAPRG